MRNRVVISEQGESFLAKGQPWMYRSNLLCTEGEAEDGEIVDIYGEGGNYIASGFYSAISHIVVRILTRKENTKIDDMFFTDSYFFFPT